LQRAHSKQLNGWSHSHPVTTA